MADDIRIVRTGQGFSIASSEFSVTYPDGHVGSIWSPPWHDKSPDDEEAGALAYAKELFAKGAHT
jgi:hypothetical protein